MPVPIILVAPFGSDYKNNADNLADQLYKGCLNFKDEFSWRPKGVWEQNKGYAMS